MPTLLIFTTALPLLAAFIYSLAALVGKSAMGRGASIWQLTLLNNGFLAVLLLTIALAVGDLASLATVSLAFWSSALLCGGLACVGLTCSFAAIRCGDISVVAPIMGCKVIFVAAISWLIYQQSLSPLLWVAVLLSAAGVIFLQGSMPRRTGLITLAFALLGVAAFAALDTVLAQEAKASGQALWLLAMSTLFGALIATFAWLLFDRRPWRNDRGLYGSAGLMSGQAGCMGLAMAIGGEPVISNIVYGTRGLWSIAMVFIATRLLTYREADSSLRTLTVRGVGAVSIFAALVIALQV